MATTKITSNVLAPNAAQNNINSDSSFSVFIPTQFTNTLTCSSSIIIAGNLTVDTNTLFVDSVNNRVGIGTATPAYRLDVGSGDVNFTNGTTLRWGTTFGIQGNNGNLRLDGGVGSIRFTSLGDISRMYVDCNNGNIGIGTTTPTERLTVSGNISVSGTVSATNIVYNTGDQPIAGVKTFSDNIVGNGAANRLPNQIATTSDSIVTKGISDNRYNTRNKRITDDTTFSQTLWEQFIDFDDQYNTDLVVANAFGPSNFGVSPPIFGEQWTTGNVGVAFQGNDLHTHRGVLLLRGQTSSNGCMYIGFNRPTNSYLLTGLTTEFTVRTFIRSTDFTTQGYFKLGPIPKGGTGGGDASLFGGLMFNPYLHPTNLVIGVRTAAAVSPFTFTTNPANVDFLDTGFNFLNILDRWINITYKMDYTNPLDPVLTVSIVRENVTLFTQNYRPLTDPVISTWNRRTALYQVGASSEIGLQYGKFTYTARSEIYFDYFYYKTTGVSSAPSNWNSLRF